MKQRSLLSLVLLFIPATSYAQTLPTDATGAVKYLSDKGLAIKKGMDGHAVGLMSSGKTALATAEYQRIGLLTRLKQIGINAAPLSDDEWRFLKSLPKLKPLSIWHGKGFATLESFSGLPIESLTIGGCIGLGDLNKDADKLRHAVKTLHDLPNLKRVSLNHSPLLPDNSYLAHVAGSFPKLEDLRLNFAAPRGSTPTITPQGLRQLQQLPLKVLAIENAGSFSEDPLADMGGVKTVQALLVAGPDSKGPPIAKRE